MINLLLSLLLINCGLLTGYVLQHWLRNQRKCREAVITTLRKRLQKVGLLGLLPFSFMLAVWIVTLQDSRLITLPFLGAAILLLGGLLALVLARILKKDARAAGTLYCCGSFTNTGSIGGVVSFALLGETGFGYLVIYKMFEELVYYLIGFPVARYYSSGSVGQSFSRRALTTFTDPFVFTALVSFALGLSLNLLNIQRPDFFNVINGFLVPTGAFVLLVSIGMGLHFTRMFGYLKEAVSISVVKFILLPAVAVSGAYVLGLGQIEGGEPVKTVLVASSMPVAFNTVVAASIYDLDLDMANACWLLTTVALIVVLPWLSLVLGFI